MGDLDETRIPRGALSVGLLAVLLLSAAGLTYSVGWSRRVQATPQENAPPVAKVIPHRLEMHDHVRIDNYHWMTERNNAEVIAYLEAENAYAEAMMAHTEALQEALFEEIRERIKETDLSVPYFRDGYYYYKRSEEGKAHPIWARKKGSLEAHEEILVDVNELAEGHEYTYVRRPEVSSANNIIAFAIDTVGARSYDIHFKDLDAGEILDEVIPGTRGYMAWANDNRTVFYVKRDSVTFRANEIYRHVLGTDPAEDDLVYEEADVTLECGVSKTKSEQYLIIHSYQPSGRSETRFLDANQPDGQFKVFLSREPNHQYDIKHFGNHFYIRTNDGAENFRLMRTPVDRTSKEHWEVVIPHRDDVLLERFHLFRDHLVVEERKRGLRQIRIRSGGDEHYLDFGEAAYAVYLIDNLETDTEILRYWYTSLTTPGSMYDYNMETRERTLLKRVEVLGGFDPDDYVTEQFYVPARDGVGVPVSIVHRKGLAKDGSNPLLLYGYGAYGSSQDLDFSSQRLSLLDRGFIYAIAHVRGGGELGRQWYEDGRLLKKRSTFTDFIDVAEHLVQEGYTNSAKLIARGGSMGGLLMGAVANMRPGLFRGIIAYVPWLVDVVGNPAAQEEVGDPDKEEHYWYMLSYSPYDNVKAQDYPNMLVTAAFAELPEQYFEPVRWVAKLRSLKTDDNRLLLRTNMHASHTGPTALYEQSRERAFQYAFMLDLLGIGQ